MRTGPVAWTAAISAFFVRYGVPPGHHGIESGYRPKSVLDEAQVEQRGQLLEYIVDGVSFRGLLLPYRAFGFHQFHSGHVRQHLDHLVEHGVSGHSVVRDEVVFVFCLPLIASSQFLGSWRTQ